MIFPPLTQLITFPELLQFHYTHNAEETIYVYAEDGKDKPTHIKYLEFVRASQRAAHLIRPGRLGPAREVVGVVALSDTLVYSAVVAGLIEAGITPLLISHRNTAAAVVNLLKKSGAHRLLCTQSTLQELLQSVKTELASSDAPYEVTFEEIPSLHNLFPKLGSETLKDPCELYPRSSYPDPDETLIILHSSGSTGLPKAIPLTHDVFFRGWISGSLSAQYRTHNVRVGSFGLPSFHALGIFTILFTPIYIGTSVAVYPPIATRPDALPVTSTPDNIIEHLQRTSCTGCFTIPAIVQIWAQSPSTVDVLRKLKVLLFGGGPLSSTTGDSLVASGVPLRAVYGGTEFGSPATYDLDENHEDWGWFRYPEAQHIRWIPQGDGTHELQLLNSDTFRVAVDNLQDVSGYATSDLWTPHPTKPGLWKIVGRADDVIIHSSGEKTVPAPFEDRVGQSPLLRGVIMFGRERDQPGVLIEPSPENQVDIDDEAQVSTFRNKVWPVIEEGNKLLPAFSRIYKEMILVTSHTKPLPRAGKGTVLRKAALKEYEREIDQIYEIVESNTSSVEPPTNWETTTLQEWLTTQVESLCHNSVGISDDIFEHGFDSLGATVLRVRLVSSLRATDNVAASRMISQNTIYNYPTIAKLSQFIIGLIESPDQDMALANNHEAAIEDMISTYSKGLDVPIPGSHVDNVPSKVVVLLTGSTGNLGAQILADLLSNDSVAEVYTLNRPSSKVSIMKRHQERFKDKDLDIGLLSSQKLVLLEGESAQPNLGLTDAVYSKLQESLTLIIHNAWRLDFNLSLSSFEPHVRGVRNLIDLARASHYASSLRFLFTSSIGSAQSWNSTTMGPYPEEVVLDPKYAVGPGYGESKYVSERILAQSGLRASSFRIGQITGGSNGAWAMSDWLPMIVKSSLVLNILPDTPGVVSWLPLDAVAGAILDVAFTPETTPLAINLVHPKPVSWTSTMSAIRESLISAKHLSPEALPLVPFQTWVKALEDAGNASPEIVSNELPAHKIIDFLRGATPASEGNAEAEALGTALGTSNIQRLSKKIKDLGPLGDVDADLWVKYWVNSGM
ncbi:acetyl-CoA synthetase-like protein [Rhodocollybia butyracea]|uniref:Acetyl-CoA synthetase-like protein n=1 Tax=Rhodocollybia butyracea TaxID=206335 RepID=A0A9P5TYZ1_9AGAR|nr:acetyl-CoA synthetase-like protein [Rhodocollybia butyracea]